MPRRARHEPDPEPIDPDDIPELRTHPFFCPYCDSDLTEDYFSSEEEGTNHYKVSLEVEYEEGIGGRQAVSGVELDFSDSDFYGVKETFECHCGGDITAFLKDLLKQYRH